MFGCDSLRDILNFLLLGLGVAVRQESLKSQQVQNYYKKDGEKELCADIQLK